MTEDRDFADGVRPAARERDGQRTVPDSAGGSPAASGAETAGAPVAPGFTGGSDAAASHGAATPGAAAPGTPQNPQPVAGRSRRQRPRRRRNCARPSPPGASRAEPPAAGDRDEASTVRLVAWVHGHVQGVGFRWWVRCQALAIGGLAGRATNYPDGRVLVIAEGSRTRAKKLLWRLREEPSRHNRPGRVDTVVESWLEPRGEVGFARR